MLALSGNHGSDFRTHRSLRARQRGGLRVEELESRTLLSAADLANLFASPAGHFALPSYSSAQSPAGYWPAQIRHAYGFDALSYTGTNETIAIVDAYDDPNIWTDLAQFDVQYGIAAPPMFTKATPQGQPAADAGWASEIALDVEWAHAIAPAANILLVEAKDSSLLNLLSAVDYAAARAQVVSMSWAAGEFSSETSYDYHFSHTGVTFVAASGDYGAPPSWPASSTHVLAVGGTTLNLNVDDTWNSETGWGYGSWSRWFGGSGGGISKYEPKPTYQSSVTQSSSHRTNPDVSYIADPNTGLAVYDSYGSGGWAVYGGTSVGAPQWAALIALVDQGRATPLSGDTQTLPAIYQLYKSSNYSTDFHDVRSGNNGYQAGTGYDLVTGVGSPRANNLVPDLMKTAVAASARSTATKQSGGAALVITKQLQQNVSGLLAPAQVAVLTSAPSPTVTFATQTGLAPVSLLRGSAPFLDAPARPLETRIESGGGDNAVLQDDDQISEDDVCLSSMFGQDQAAALVLPVAIDSAIETQSAAGLRQARDACFVDWIPGQKTRESRTAPATAGLMLDSPAGQSCLAVIFGCYWSAHFKESERRASPGWRTVAASN